MSQNNKAQHRLRPLPRGRHGFDPDALRATRRARLLEAMMRAVAKRGYAATTVPEVVAAARVSRNAFYEFFEDKEACFLALCDEKARELLRIALVFAGEEDWRAALRGGVQGYLRWWQENPEFARTYFVEMPVAGARAAAQRRKAYDTFEAMFAQLAQRMRGSKPRKSPLPTAAPRMAVLAVTEFIADEVRAGRTHLLSRRDDDLLYLIARLLGGDY